MDTRLDTNEKILKYSEDDVRRLLDAQARRLGKIKKVIWKTSKINFNLNIVRILSDGDDGLIIEVE